MGPLKAEKCTRSGCPNIKSDGGKSCLPAATAAKYDDLVASIKSTLQAIEDHPEEEEVQSTFEFTLINLIEANAADQKKHICLDAPTEDINVHFAPCTQKLTITATNITTCHEFDSLTIPAELIGTTDHIPVFTTVNCAIYSTQPIAKYTLDYSLPEVKGAPRGDKKTLSTFLKKNCRDFLEWAPYAVKYKMNLGVVGAKDLKRKFWVRRNLRRRRERCLMRSETFGKLNDDDYEMMDLRLL